MKEGANRSAGLWFPRLLLLVAMVGAIEAPASAQTESDFELWGALFFTGRVFEKTPSPSFWFDTHARRSESGTVYILRPGVGFAFAPWGSIWLGYAWTPTWVDATGERQDEHRVWEQLTLTSTQVSGLLLQSRTRFEQRFQTGPTGTAHRFRQFVRLNYRPKQRVPVGIAFVDEVFVGIQGAGWAAQGFDQNRVFLGLAVYAPEALLRVEVGYLNVFLSRQPNRLAHVLSLNFFVSFGGRARGG
ncbi:MAG: DUF2490 domain-containing protein [Myxococcales bacterium]|nr:DUF2490 domain-containing protein [Myxococcales bacterium]